MGDDDKDVDDPTPETVRKVLLKEKPGRIDYLATEVMEHPLPVINIYTRTEGRLLVEKPSAFAKKGVFSEQRGEFTFVIPDLEHTTNVLLSFKDKHWYTGITDDLKRRFEEHNKGLAYATTKRRPFKLIYYEACLHKNVAQARETYLKSGKGKKYLAKRLRRFLAKQRSGFGPSSGTP